MARSKWRVAEISPAGDSHQLMPQRPHGIPYMHHQVIAITPAPWIEIEADFTMVLTADGEAP
ncbi:hypothetical protein [Pseudomonas aeruginosa]|uniref:hypothetical protein n=1 Tax=Pseudomonas aeruginosa TaxID=287 RepID=UPI001C61630D|nr:hypothetical protein [Pseudomonas aeruginosa]